MRSLWHARRTLPSFDQLKESKSTDVLIIGGGLCGILCAYMLDRAGVSYILAEADTICRGVSGNTTAKITAQHGLIYDSIAERFGIEAAKKYYLANTQSIGEYRRLCRELGCEIEKVDSFVYSTGKTDRLLRELQTMRRIGIDAEIKKELPLPIKVSGAISMRDQAQFDPIEFAGAISKGLNIYEHTPIRKFDGEKYYFDYGTIRAKKAIVTTHFPIWNKHGGYYLKLYQHRSYVLALENAQSVDGIYVDEAKDGLSFRNFEELLLLGGGSHRTGKKGGGWAELEDFCKKHYPHSRIRYRFATQDCMSLDSIAYIGRYSESTEGLYVASGFNKWGMSTSMVAAQLLRDMILGRKNPYEELYSPSRSIFRAQLALNAAHSALGLITPTAPRCTHLGCALKWNSAEHTWDCSCHGSRFDEEGHLLENPALRDLGQKK